MYDAACCNTIRNITLIHKTAQEAVNNEVLVLTGEARSKSDMDFLDLDLGDNGNDR